MDIKQALIGDIRNFKAPDLAKKIVSQHAETELVNLALNKDVLLSSRAMWVLAHCSDLEYEKIKPFHLKLINNLKNNGLHNGVIRNTLRLFQKHSVPLKSQSFMLDKCFEYIKNPSQAIAVRAFAITIIFNIAKPYPELLHELEIILHHIRITESGAGITSRVKNTLNAIHKLQKEIKKTI